MDKKKIYIITLITAVAIIISIAVFLLNNPVSDTVKISEQPEKKSAASDNVVIKKIEVSEPTDSEQVNIDVKSINRILKKSSSQIEAKKEAEKILITDKSKGGKR